jgi:hypothetical protein
MILQVTTRILTFFDEIIMIRGMKQRKRRSGTRRKLTLASDAFFVLILCALLKNKTNYLPVLEG